MYFIVYPLFRTLNIYINIMIKNLKHLGTGASYVQPLSWNHRMKIALGAAKGLAFLHSDNVKVIYRDVKTSNILLDSVRSAFSTVI